MVKLIEREASTHCVEIMRPVTLTLALSLKGEGKGSQALSGGWLSRPVSTPVLCWKLS